MSGAQAKNSAAADARIFRILDRLLRISRWVLAFVLVSIPLMVAGAPFLPIQIGSDPADESARWPTIYFGAIFDRDEMTETAFLVQAAGEFVFVALGIFIMTQMLRILENVRAGRAFAAANGERLRRIGYAGIYAQLAVYALWFIAEAAEIAGLVSVDGLEIRISPDSWIAIVSAFALSTIFLEGAALKEEQELTV